VVSGPVVTGPAGSDPTSSDKVRVLSHVGGAAGLGLPPELAERVEVVALSMQGPAPEGIRGEVLVTVPGWSENTDELLARGVRWIHFVSTGIDRVDFGRLSADVVVTNSRGASAIPISEWVLAVMLAHEKHLPEVWIDRPPPDWRSDARLGTLHGRRLAVIGFGSIGEAVARRALPFGMVVRGLRRTDRPSAVPGVELVGSVAESVADADHVVIAAPLTPATHHLVDQDAFSAMKPGVHLVNIARGGLVDQDALRVALDDGVVGLASLDAVDPEPLPDGHWMYTHPRVRLSAHDSWSWPGAFPAMFERFVVNLEAWLDGRALPDLVDPAQGY
jgi:phosphoglycerate dehydrogenase-like enzyme